MNKGNKARKMRLPDLLQYSQIELELVKQQTHKSAVNMGYGDGMQPYY
jgi:hypothetical protein